MRKLRIFFILVCIIMTLGIISWGEYVGGDEDPGFNGLTVSAQYEEDCVIIPVSELSRAMDMNFSFNEDSGILYTEKDGYSLYFKLMDEEHELDERGLVLYGREEDKPFDSYKVKLLMQYAVDSYDSNLSEVFDKLSVGSDAAGKAIKLIEASITVEDSKGYISFEKIGTSTSEINNDSLKEILNNHLLLVNRDNTLSNDYVPQNLTKVAPSKGGVSVNMKVEKEVMDNLNILLEEAYSDGIKDYLITSAYRDYNKQKNLFSNKVNSLLKNMGRDAAEKEAATIVAVPGTSEHQTGMAVDICNFTTSLERAFADTPHGKWLEKNSWKYGFIVRYQKDKMDITKIIYEPWHLRYVGVGHSEYMKMNNLCMEEYIEYLKGNRMISFETQDGSKYIVEYIEKSELEDTGLMLDLPENYQWMVSNVDKDGYALTITY